MLFALEPDQPPGGFSRKSVHRNDLKVSILQFVLYTDQWHNRVTQACHNRILHRFIRSKFHLWTYIQTTALNKFFHDHPGTRSFLTKDQRQFFQNVFRIRCFLKFLLSTGVVGTIDTSEKSTVFCSRLSMTLLLFLTSMISSRFLCCFIKGERKNGSTYLPVETVDSFKRPVSWPLNAWVFRLMMAICSRTPSAN
jgi:hypothetical protein